MLKQVNGTDNKVCISFLTPFSINFKNITFDVIKANFIEKNKNKRIEVVLSGGIY